MRETPGSIPTSTKKIHPPCIFSIQSLKHTFSTGMLGLEAEKPGLGLGLGLVGCGLGLGLVGCGSALWVLASNLEASRGLQLKRNVIGSKSITNSQKFLLPLRIASWSYCMQRLCDWVKGRSMCRTFTFSHLHKFTFTLSVKTFIHKNIW